MKKTEHRLPEQFLEKMERLLGEEYEAFRSSYKLAKTQGLRVNLLKLTPEDFTARSPFRLERVPWCETGFHYPESDRPGKHPYYYAGLYYIQEPSAMAPVELLDVQPGERVLDLCAAPGGKSTQIAAKLLGSGLLVANDIHADRVKALIKNVELSGTRNAVILQEQPHKLAQKFGRRFDKILVDAPCSGEGMFRKDEAMNAAWKPDWTSKYAAEQMALLRQAAQMVVPGGRIVYSTCTFAPEENEQTIARFLQEHRQFELIEPTWCAEFAHGRPEWLQPEQGEASRAAVSDMIAMSESDAASFDASRTADIARTIRLWPHRLKGEGHFAAVLQLRQDAADGARQTARAGRLPEPERVQRELLERFIAGAVSDHFSQWLREQRWVSYGGHMYCISEHAEALALDGIKTVRQGWYLGQAGKYRFEPSQAFAMGLRRHDAAVTIDYAAAAEETIRYLKGETLAVPERLRGYALVCMDGFPLGWGKAQDGILKNVYAPGWRWNS